ncbi:MAG: NAD(P)H-binding protein [Solirubrobacterales bacterium]
MDIVVIGGHGKVGLQLLKLLAGRGDTARGVIRDPAQAPDLEAVGATPIVLDIENREIGDAVAGADAVVFAAGAGAGSGPARKRTVDYAGAVALIEAARAHGISRYLMVSAMGVNHPERWSEQMRPYYEAKADADAGLEQSGPRLHDRPPGPPHR